MTRAGRKDEHRFQTRAVGGPPGRHLLADHSTGTCSPCSRVSLRRPRPGLLVQENLSVEATLTAYDPLSYDNALPP